MVLVTLILILLSASCGTGKYSDLRDALEKQKKIQETFISNMDKAEDPASVASALSAYSRSMMELQPVYEELEKKYPDMDEMPKELDDINKELSGQEEIIAGRITEKILKYADDPAVQKEFMNLGSPEEQ